MYTNIRGLKGKINGLTEVLHEYEPQILSIHVVKSHKIPDPDVDPIFLDGQDSDPENIDQVPKRW